LLENPLAKVIIAGKIRDSDHVGVDSGANRLVFKKESLP
jgi:hypothetical protein